MATPDQRPFLQRRWKEVLGQADNSLHVAQQVFVRACADWASKDSLQLIYHLKS